MNRPNRRAQMPRNSYYSGTGVKIQRLSAEQESSLFAELAANRSCPRVREKVVKAFLGFALNQALKDYWSHGDKTATKCGLGLDDAISAANMGLMKALDRFDYTRGFRFTTYAGWWIKKSLHDSRYSSFVVAVTRSDRENFVLYRRLAASGLTEEAIAELERAPVGHVKRILGLAGGRQDPLIPAVLAKRKVDGHDTAYPSGADLLEQQEERSKLVVAMASLEQSDRELITDHFSGNLSPREILKKHGASYAGRLPRILEKLKTLIAH